MIQFPYSAATQTETRLAGLLSAGAGPTLAEHLREMQLSSQPTKRRISGAVFRDLTTGVGSAGGYTVGTKNLPMEQLLRRYSIFGELGLNIISGLDGPITIPRCATVPTATWLPTDGTSMTESQPVFGQLALTPKFCSAFMQVSRQLVLQSQAENIIAAMAAEAIGVAIDAAIIAGTGTNGQPSGLVNASGVYAQSGTSLALAGILNMREQVLLSGAREDRLVWLGHPTQQELLAARERFTGGGKTLWDDDGILGRPAIATKNVPSGSLICGDASRITVAVFDAAGIELEYDNYSDFRSGISAFRILVPVDVAVSPAAAFAVASSIT
jgi:HK97 family phage major capsid protein